MGHSQQEEQKLFFITIKYLFDKEYKPNENDMNFLNEYGEHLITEQVTEFINKL